MEFEYASSRASEPFRYRLAALILAPVFALVLQAYLPLYFSSASLLNLPLLVVLCFALASRDPVVGLMMGALVGVAQDSLSRDAIGLFAIPNTIIGYVASFFSGFVDTENMSIRLISIFSLYWLHLVLFSFVEFTLPVAALEIPILRTFLATLVNALIGVLLFEVLDRFRKPA